MICSKFITFAVTKTTWYAERLSAVELWFAQNSLPLRWQRQLCALSYIFSIGCDLLKIHYLCGDKDNIDYKINALRKVVICSKFITFAVTKTTRNCVLKLDPKLWFAQNSLPLRWQRQLIRSRLTAKPVVICSKFITFAVTKTTNVPYLNYHCLLWFAQNSLPLRWQRQQVFINMEDWICCDLLKIHYLCGDKDNRPLTCRSLYLLWFAQNSLPLRWQRQPIRHGSFVCNRCDLLKIHYLCGDKDNSKTRNMPRW